MSGRHRGPIDLLFRPMPGPEPVPDHRYREPDLAANHNLLWMAAMSALSPLPEVAAWHEQDRTRAPSSAVEGRRWSGDAWIVWREGSSRLDGLGALTPVYGASQLGAVVRYDLAPSSSYRPAAYVRVVHALNGAPEGDLAAGLVLRPIARLPVAVHGEARVSRRGQDHTLRPAAFLSGGIDAVPVAGQLTVRGYAQGGYVGGRGSTAFADGSLIAERALRRDGVDVAAAGVGVWGGAQRDAARLDVGPTASLRLRLGQANARISADYRLRFVGNAEPASGAALTLSAGF